MNGHPQKENEGIECKRVIFVGTQRQVYHVTYIDMRT
jgi:hypothetical protein